MSQDIKRRVESEATRLMRAGVAGQVFPGGVASISWTDGGETLYASVAAGKLSADDDDVSVSTPYDIASITKPFVAMTALRLVATGKMSLDTRADSIVADVRGGTGGLATLGALLSHTSGLSAWGGLYLDVPHDPGTPAARRWILSEASRRPHDEDTRLPIYSDLGYIIAGEVVARCGGDKLDRVLAREITDPLGISDEIFFPAALPSDRRAQVARLAAPTEWCEWRQRMVRGEVHDENAAAFGGVAGNAGLFGTAHGAAVFGRAMLDVLAGKSNLVDAGLLRHALTPVPGTSLMMGWDGKSADASSAGKRMSDATFGHLGFTGCSVWCDPDRDVVVALLTNRVHPSRANERIKGFRPGFHDGVLAALGK